MTRVGEEHTPEPSASVERADRGPSAPGAPPEPSRFIRVLDTEPAGQAAPAEPARRASAPSAAEQVLGAERLELLRARYAELLARIQMRGGDPARQQALRERAQGVNPDAWVTEQEVRDALSNLEATLEDLHGLVGRRRRRRRRGTRRIAGEPGGPSTADAESDGGPDEAPPETDDLPPTED